MKTNLTELGVRKLKVTGKRYQISDALLNDFAVRVGASGKKSFSYRYRFRGRQRRRTWGPWPQIALATARGKAKEIAAKIARSEDPDPGQSEMTFSDLADLYLESYAEQEKSPRSVLEDIRMLKAYIRPVWGKRIVTDIKRADVVKLLERIAFKRKRKAPIMSNRVRALIHTIFSVGIKKGWLDEEFINPCRNIEPLGKERSRNRVLSDDELRTLWQFLDSREELTSHIYRLILLTCQRGGEVGAMRWMEIEGDLWTIPAEATKNKKEEHKVPLSTWALHILEEIQAISGDEEFVFPSRRTGGHVQWMQKNTWRICKKVGFHFTPHDLRRTSATNLSKIGVDDVLIARILNHSWAKRQVTSVYNRWAKLPEMRQALERWSSRLQQIVTEQPAKLLKMR